MTNPLLARFLDERFLEHRRRSTSFAGIVSAVLALVLFEWRWLVNHRLDWDLLAVGGTFVALKYALFAWYRHTD